ncbi:DUF5916 domain-containing protein [candidate division KSB1 bacterium]
MKKYVCLCLLPLLWNTVELRAHEEMEYVVRAVEIGPGQAPRIDGRLDDPAWTQANKITGFIQRDPTAGIPATERSEVFILYDKENLYVGCRFYDSNPGNIFRELRRREEIESSDRIELFFDTFHDHRNGFKFSMNPYGVQLDEIRFADSNRDRSWNAIWESAAGIDSIGWVAECRIPFFNFRFPDTEEQVWGFNLQREIRYKAERINWKPISIHDRMSVRMSKLGHLTGIKGIRPGRRLELFPYGLSGTSQTDETPRTGKNEVGLDFKYGVTSDITLDMTVNPDYAQIEADVLDINLTRFPTRFSERRQFFLEGRGIFQTPIELFYSRRIGAAGDILWGSKLSGRSQKNGIEYGLLTAGTGDWNYFGLTEKNSDREEAIFGIARVKKGFSDGSSIGLAATDKQIDGDGYNRAFGVDGLFNLGDVHTANFQVASSFNTGLSQDNKYLSLGLFRSAIPWTFRLTTQQVQPNFEINGVGFMPKEAHRGFRNYRGVFSYNPFVEKRGIRQVNIFTSIRGGQDVFTQQYIDNWTENNPDSPVEQKFLDGDLTPWHFLIDGSWGVRTTNEMNIGYWWAYGKSNELNQVTYDKRHGFNISSPRTGRAQKLSANLGGSIGTFYNFAQKHEGSSWNVRLNGTSWIMSNLGLELTTEYTRTYDPGEIIDGKHFRFTMRNTWLVTKDLFLRLHTQGRWGTTFYGDKRTSNRYLGSLLLGWEFRPGSWFYLAYNEGRKDETDPDFQPIDFLMTDRTLVAKIQYAFHM